MPVKLFIDSTSLPMFSSDIQGLAEDFGRRGAMRQPLLRSAREVLSPSIGANFDAGGRPPWDPVIPDSSYRKKLGGGGGPLSVTGKLQKSAEAFARWHVADNVLTYGNFPSSTWFAVVHDSEDVAAKANIPARPFALIQEEDIAPIGDIFMDWVEEKVGDHIRLRYP